MIASSLDHAAVCSPRKGSLMPRKLASGPAFGTSVIAIRWRSMESRTTPAIQMTCAAASCSRIPRRLLRLNDTIKHRGDLAGGEFEGRLNQCKLLRLNLHVPEFLGQADAVFGESN